MYLVVILAPFIYRLSAAAPTVNHPPTRIRWFDHEGDSTGGLCVPYGAQPGSRLEVTWEEDHSVNIPFTFWCGGRATAYSDWKPTSIFWGGPGIWRPVVSVWDRPVWEDVFSRTLYGETSHERRGVRHRPQLVIRVVMGGISGYYGGAVDNLIQRFIELLRSFLSSPMAGFVNDSPGQLVLGEVSLGVVLSSPPNWTGVARSYGAVPQPPHRNLESARALG